MLNRLLVRLVDQSRRYALAVVPLGLLLAALCGLYAAGHLGVTTDTDELFSASLPWRQHAIELNKDFPQFRNLLVAVIDAQEPEEAEATAAALAAAARRRSRPFPTRSAGPTRRLSCKRKGCCSSIRSRSRT